MISTNTLHVVATELVVGAFALSGVAFLLCLAHQYLPASIRSSYRSLDAVAHSAMLFGLIATPFAIWTGLSSAPGGEMSSPILANKMLFSMSGLGLASGVLLARWRVGISLWDEARSRLIQGISGLGAVGFMLVTASAGGTFSRGESLLDWLHLPYSEALLMPTALSAILLLVGIACTTIGLRSNA